MYVDTDAVRWFQQVADGMTVTEVSELERVTQLGVSRALARFETEVGTPLLRRTGRTLRMTHVDVSGWTVADKTSSLSPTPPRTLPVVSPTMVSHGDTEPAMARCSRDWPARSRSAISAISAVEKLEIREPAARCCSSCDLRARSACTM